MAFDLNKVIEANKTEDGLNVEEVMKAIDNDYVNPIIASKKPNLEKANQEFLGSVMKDLGIDGNTLDDFKVWTKKMGGNTDQFKEENITLSNQLKELKGKYEEVSNEYGKVKQEYATTAQLSKIKDIGIVGEEAEFLQYKLSKQVTEETPFDKLLEEYAKEEQKTKTDQKFVKKNFKSTGGEFMDAFNSRKKY